MIAGQGSAQAGDAYHAEQAVSYGPESVQPEPAERDAEGAIGKDETCVNHPWRHAYGRCSYCGRAYCYADLVPHGKEQYCLDDLGHAYSAKQKDTISPDRFTYISSLLFIVSSLTLLYYTYPQIYFVAQQIAKVGALQFISSLSYGYSIVIASAVLMALGLISSVLVMSPSRKRFFASALVLVVMLVFYSYQYLSGASIGTADYLLYVMVALLANMVSLALGGMGYAGRRQEAQFQEQQLEWPRLETF